MLWYGQNATERTRVFGLIGPLKLLWRLLCFITYLLLWAYHKYKQRQGGNPDDDDIENNPPQQNVQQGGQNFQEGKYARNILFRGGSRIFPMGGQVK